MPTVSLGAGSERRRVRVREVMNERQKERQTSREMERQIESRPTEHHLCVDVPVTTDNRHTSKSERRVTEREGDHERDRDS